MLCMRKVSVHRQLKQSKVSVHQDAAEAKDFISMKDDIISRKTILASSSDDQEAGSTVLSSLDAVGDSRAPSAVGTRGTRAGHFKGRSRGSARTPCLGSTPQIQPILSLQLFLVKVVTFVVHLCCGNDTKCCQARTSFSLSDTPAPCSV